MVKIISGGQTGVDRAALDVANALDIPYGGWCPQGGWAEDLPNPPGLLAIYPHLRETSLRDPRQRTEWNVRDCDALLLLTGKAGVSVSKGTGFAVACAKRLGKPHLILGLDVADARMLAKAWLDERAEPLALAIGGPRESEAAGICAAAHEFLREQLAGMRWQRTGAELVRPGGR